jgi:2-polyprenyl-6-hydroxyphenyl methylase/3-demethylubiquinone-9 3-methyltransferase
MQVTIEDLIKEEEYINHFDFAASMEVIEHVQNPEKFVMDMTRSVKPGGLIFLSTIARTMEAWLLTVKVAEDVVGVVPQGTHDWDKFINPDELNEMVTNAGCAVLDTQGTIYDPINNYMYNRSSTDNNYMMVAKKL